MARTTTRTTSPDRRPLAGPAGDCLSASGVAARLGIGVSTAKRLLAGGAVPTVRFGSVVRVRVGDLDAWVAEQVTPRVR